MRLALTSMGDAAYTARLRRCISARSLRRLALIAAALLLFAQTAAAAHYHPQLASARASLAPVVNVDAGVCALCLLAVHFPANPAATPSLARPQPALSALATAAPERAVVPDRTSAPTRAPPSRVV